MCTRRPSATPTTWRGASLTHGTASHRASSTTPLTTGQYGCMHARRPEVVTLNICYNWPVLFRDTHVLHQEKTHACGVLKRHNFWVHVSPGSAETLVGRGGIINHHSIAYSLSNISAKNYRNQLMCVESIVSFFETQCISLLELTTLNTCRSMESAWSSSTPRSNRNQGNFHKTIIYKRACKTVRNLKTLFKAM